jgi:GntR family histidine utilization transcriptional repressor
MKAPAAITPLARNAAAPIYQQIKDAILARIRSGEWAPGTQVPSENALAADLHVSRMTAHRALRELTERGHLTRVHGVGTFVAEPPRHASLIELRDIAEEIASQGRRHRADVKVRETAPAPYDVATRMEMAPGAPVCHVVLVHYQDEVPIQLEDRYVNPAVVPDFLALDFGTKTPTRHLLDRVRPDELEHIVQAALPDATASSLLAIPADEPCLRLLRRTWSGGTVVTAVSLLYPSSRYDLSARYRIDTIR